MKSAFGLALVRLPGQLGLKMSVFASLEKFVASQLAKPQGRVGRYVFAPLLNRVNKGMNAAVLKVMRLGPQDRVLEIGFGGAAMLRAILAGPAASVHGLDLSLDMVRQARSRLTRELDSGRLELVAGTAEQLPYEDGSIDVVCAVNVIYFWPEPALAVREIHRVLSPGGRVVFGHAGLEDMKRMAVTKHGFHLRDNATIQAWLRDAGFDAVETTTARNMGREEHCTLGRKA